jgi:ATP-binding cassette subfamily B protein
VKSFFSFIISVTRPFWKHAAGLWLVSVGWALVVTLQPYVVKQVIDTVMNTSGPQLYTKLLWLLAAYLGVGLGFISLNFYYDFLIVRFFPAQKEFITVKLMRRLMRYPVSFYQKHFAGSLTGKINDVVSHASNLIEIFADNFTTCFFTLIFVIINMIYIDVRFVWALLVWLVIFLGGSLWMLFSHSDLSYYSAEARSKVLGHIVDLFANMSSVRLFFRHNHELRLVQQIAHKASLKERARDRFFLKLHLFQGVSFSVFELSCFYWLLSGLSNKTISPGSFVLLLTLNLQILNQFWSLGTEIRDFWEKMGALQQALGTIYSVEQIKETRPESELVVTKGRIDFEDVYFSYGEGPIFEGQSVSILPGQRLGVVGLSGGGKTTFVNLILKLYDIQGGKILIDGQDIATVSLEGLRQAISVIPQECILFNRSVEDNIRYGKPDASEEEVREAARKAQIHTTIENLPNGYHTLAGERGMKFSGGQRQRITIARAILKDAPILIMDEPTSSMDGVTEEELGKAFAQVMKGKTVIMIAHRLHTLMEMDRILVFGEGKIVQDGPHEQLIQQEGLYRKLWNLQMVNIKKK